MKYFETHLDSQQFVRIHRSYLVNLSQISEIQQYEKESWMVLTKQGAKIKVSKAGLHQPERKAKNLNNRLMAYRL